MNVQKLPFGQLLGDGSCVTKCLAFWTQEPSPRIRLEVTFYSKLLILSFHPINLYRGRYNRKLDFPGH